MLRTLNQPLYWEFEISLWEILVNSVLLLRLIRISLPSLTKSCILDLCSSSCSVQVTLLATVKCSSFRDYSYCLVVFTTTLVKNFLGTLSHLFTGKKNDLGRALLPSSLLLVAPWNMFLGGGYLLTLWPCCWLCIEVGVLFGILIVLKLSHTCFFFRFWGNEVGDWIFLWAIKFLMWAFPCNFSCQIPFGQQI